MKTPTSLFPIGTLRGYFFSYAMSSVYGTLTILETLMQVFKNRKDFFSAKPRPEPPKCLTDSQWGQHNYVRCRNIKLHYVSNGDPNKPLILFLHGFPEMWYSWRYQMKDFSKDYFTVALNMRGYGDSDKPIGVANYSVDKLVQDVKDFVDTLGKKNCILVSHDWGGLVGWSVAAHYPEMVDKFIVCNAPNIKYFKRCIESNWKQFFMSWYIYFFNLPYLPELRFRANDYKVFDVIFSKYCTPEEVDAYKYYFSKPYGLTAPINYYRAFQRGYGDRSFLKSIEHKRIKCPTLVIWGRKDTALTESLAEESCEACDDYTIRKIDDCSHWTPFDKPDLVNQYIREFLTRK